MEQKPDWDKINKKRERDIRVGQAINLAHAEILTLHNIKGMEINKLKLLMQETTEKYKTIIDVIQRSYTVAYETVNTEIVKEPIQEQKFEF